MTEPVVLPVTNQRKGWTMDGKRFDNWTRKLSRRQAVGAAGVAGIAAAVGRVLPSDAQFTGATCQMTVQALTSAGPSFGTAYSGVLQIAVGTDGAIDNGSFAFDGGPTVPVVGQADGRALSLRATFPNGNALVLTGTGEKPIAQCSGALSGGLSGPELGDTGSWLIDPSKSQQTGSSSSVPTATATTASGSVSTPTPTPCPDMECDSPFVLLPDTCACGCTPPYQVCGNVCCPGGSNCTDPNSGECSCPDGTELCGDNCVQSCSSGSYLDPNSCQCVEGCNLQCDEGQDLDETTCTCVNTCGDTSATPYYCQGNCYAQQQASCTSGCVEISQTYSNPNLCGSTCQVCPTGMPCIGGTCECPVDYSYCSGVGCYDLSSDANNCGSCGNVCQTGLVCKLGQCKEN